MVAEPKPVFVLDATALLRFFDDEPGAERVEELLVDCARERASLRISAMQWGEIAASLRLRFGNGQPDRMLHGGLPQEFEVVPATAERAARAAVIQVDRGVSRMASYAVELSQSIPNSTLVTADSSFKVFEDLVRVEILPRS